jgi:hypothetical protein
MSITLTTYLQLASGLLATTYGWGEAMCGDPGNPRQCVSGQPTASGLPLRPQAAQAAVAVPGYIRIPPEGIYIGIRLAGRPHECHMIHLVDKMSERWIGQRGWDLTPGAVRRITGMDPVRGWSAPVELCTLPRLVRRDPIWETLPSLRRLPA